MSEGFTAQVSFDVDDQSIRHYKVLQNERDHHQLPHWIASRSCVENGGTLPTDLTKSQATKLAREVGVDMLPVGLYGLLEDQTVTPAESVLVWNDGREIYRGDPDLFLQECSSDYTIVPHNSDYQQTGGAFFNGTHHFRYVHT